MLKEILQQMINNHLKALEGLESVRENGSNFVGMNGESLGDLIALEIAAIERLQRTLDNMLAETS